MNTSPSSPQESRSLGYWLKAVDRLMSAEFRAAFANEGISRREWRLLSIVDGSRSSDRPLHGPKLRRLADRGWITHDRDGWILTESGSAAKTRLAAIVDGIRATATDAVDPDDLATTMATLEKLAVAYGWDAETPLPRREHRFGGRGRHDRFGRRDRGHGFDHGHGHRFTHSDCDGTRSYAGHHEYSAGYGHGYGHRHDREYGHGRHGANRGGRHGHAGYSHGDHVAHGFDADYAPQHPHCDHAPERHGRHRGMPLKPHRGFGRGRG